MTNKYICKLLFLMAFLLLLENTNYPAQAQVLSESAKTGGGIEIEAKDGIEWIRDEVAKTGQYHARGDAVARRDGVVINADELIAYYRPDATGKGQDIFRMDAIGHVKIISENSTAIGDKAVYHIDKKVAVLVGDNLKFKSPNAVITAKESLEYWETKSIAVARGDATVVQGDKRLQAGVLTAFITTNKKTKKQDIERIDATSGVHISTPTEIVRGREGVYNLTTEIATLCGDVKITRGQNQLNGECAEVNMKTGRSEIKGGSGKVKGLIIPSQ